jgi:hypothetical protein
MISTQIDRRVFSGRPGTVCNRCHHTRVKQPYIKLTYSIRGNIRRTEIVCWKCIHDYESCFAIKATYGDFLSVVKRGSWHYLELKPNLQTFLEFTDDE